MGGTTPSGVRAVCSHDEDTATMGVEAARIALSSLSDSINPAAVWFSSSNPPYMDKTNANVIASCQRSQWVQNLVSFVSFYVSLFQRISIFAAAWLQRRVARGYTAANIVFLIFGFSHFFVIWFLVKPFLNNNKYINARDRLILGVVRHHRSLIVGIVDIVELASLGEQPRPLRASQARARWRI